VDDMKVVLLELARSQWASRSCTVLLVGPKHAWNFRMASDLSTDDPFDSEHGQEFLCFTKERGFRQFGSTSSEVWMNVSWGGGGR
jgi:hypothetical protein